MRHGKLLACAALVEDGDHVFVISSLMQKRSNYVPFQPTQSLSIKKLGDVTEVLDFDRVLVEWQSSNLKRLGLVVDADNNASFPARKAGETKKM